MARTKDELIAVIVNNKTDELIGRSIWSDLTSAVGSMTAEEKAELLGHIILRNDTQAGFALYNKLKEEVRAKAVVGATSLLADEKLTLAELDLIL